MEKIINTIANEIKEVLQQTSENETIQLAEEIQAANRIFVAGTGRSGLVGKVFAMRLMHSGYSTYVVGETITPSIEPNDLLIIISGSGSTGSLTQYAKKAKEADAKAALITTNPDSVIGKGSDCIVRIPAATKKRLASEPNTIQPLGSQFDQSAHLLLDAVVVYLLQQMPEVQHSKLNKKHANLE
ncbi:6-phospho-3-hexuloisomerase [Virgibacillus indicus]|uniref:6-phospho-3-hexuloisomerase n=1 Tax=Virgibacillus indicus TaxID=2024554 RepID=A0A265NA80_9BACI|nr:6-phospho-3-hexuloisomerase [Virgibacillus indicus]OZU88206.1 6-phospho-3-hexuloisomerase [Virgibacillus indicus]